MSYDSAVAPGGSKRGYDIANPIRSIALFRVFFGITTLAMFALGSCAASQSTRARSEHVSSQTNSTTARLRYTGVDGRGIPHYSTLMLSRADSLVLRRAYGIEDPHRLYVSDSSVQGILKYDTKVKRCRVCYVNSYRIGYVSVRRTNESWEQAERRVRATPARLFRDRVHAQSASTADLDPDIRPLADAMLSASRAAGFHLRVAATYRSPRREAYLMAEGGSQTHTLTSNHSYGRALDIIVDDGNRAHARTKGDWIAFRRWVTRYPTPIGESFRILGQPGRTWDWAHIALPSSTIGFRSIPQAIARARACIAPGAKVPCNFAPRLPWGD
jgi:uncharacterized protein YcbK (DUF882 family)